MGALIQYFVGSDVGVLFGRINGCKEGLKCSIFSEVYYGGWGCMVFGEAKVEHLLSCAV